ncbi:MAG: hypothetical protein ACOZJX_09120 [Pseudomonadota bacterium]
MRNLFLVFVSVLIQSLASAAVVVDASNGIVRGDKLFDPAGAQYSPFSELGYRVEVVKEGKRIDVLLSERRQLRLRIPDEVAQIHRIRIGNDRVIVSGWMNGALATCVAAFDLKSGGLVDKFWGYAPSISPDARFIAFVKFFPSHGVERWEDQYRLYDLLKSPQENRLPLLADSDSAVGNQQVEVGQVLYPLRLKEANRRWYDIREGDQHQRAAHFGWSKNSREVAILDTYQGRVTAVLVSVPINGKMPSSVLVAPVVALNLRCSPGNVSSCTSIPPESVELTLDEVGLRVKSHATASSSPVLIRRGDMVSATN